MSGATFREKLDNEPDLMASHQDRSVKYNDNCYGKCPKCFRCCWLTCGILLFIIAIQATFLPALLNNAITNGIEEALIFTSAQNDNSNYQTWLTNTFGDNAVPIWMECRFFNVTNKDEILNPPINNENWTYPKLHLTPPLIYDEWYYKYDVNFNYHNLSQWVEYKTWTYYTVRQKKMYAEQIGPKSHIVIISPVIGLLYYEWLWPKNDSKISKYEMHELSKLLNNLDPNLLFWEGTAEEILFNISQINITIDGNNLLSVQLDQGLLGNGSSPEMNDSSSYEVAHTGHGAPQRMGEVLFYGDIEKGWLDCYDTPMQIWPAKDTFFGIGNVRPHDIQILFVDTLYKNVALNYNYSYTWIDDIELYRYTVQMLPQYLNASLWPPNKQFNLFGTSGVQNLTSCMTLPIFVSFPEFLGADDFIPNNTKMGLDPNPSWDLLPTVDVEPRTGGIYRANKSLQLNTIIHSLPFNYSFNYNRSQLFTENQIYKDRTDKRNKLWGNKSLHFIADDLMVPMVELSECTQLPDKQAKSFSNQVIGTTHWANRLQWIGVASGCLFAAWATVCGWGLAKRNQQNKYIVQ
eukprot:317744_1